MCPNFQLEGLHKERRFLLGCFSHSLVGEVERVSDVLFESAESRDAGCIEFFSNVEEQY